METKPIIVIGDIILDRYLRGTASRLSPEAPVPIVDVSDPDCHSTSLGGAGNVAANIVSLGGEVALLGLLGHDGPATEVDAILKRLNISKTLVVRDSYRRTTVKTRVMAANHQLLRFDSESHTEMDSGVQNFLLDGLRRLAPTAGALVISDYAKGVLTEKIAFHIYKLSGEYGFPVFIDPRVSNKRLYMTAAGARGITVITPNISEAEGLSGMRIFNDLSATDVGVRILETLGVDYVLITRGEQGMSLVSARDTLHIRTVADAVFDVSGAGDTVIATMALMVARGNTTRLAARIANLAAGVVVGKSGTATVTQAELNAQADKVCFLEDA